LRNKKGPVFFYIYF